MSEAEPISEPPVPPTAKGASTRRRILDAGVELFAAQGYHATTINEIGLRSGVMRGALYYHIKAKEDLLYEVLCRHVEAVLEAARPIVATDIPPAEKLIRLGRVHAETILERHLEVTIYMRDARALTGERAKRLRGLQADVEALWMQLYDEAVQAGAVRPVDPIAIKGVIGMVNSVHSWYRPDGRLDAVAIAEHLVDVAIRGLLVAAVDPLPCVRGR